jgi:hypothetical protein
MKAPCCSKMPNTCPPSTSPAISPVVKPRRAPRDWLAACLQRMGTLWAAIHAALRPSQWVQAGADARLEALASAVGLLEGAGAGALQQPLQYMAVQLREDKQWQKYCNKEAENFKESQVGHFVNRLLQHASMTWVSLQLVKLPDCAFVQHNSKVGNSCTHGQALRNHCQKAACVGAQHIQDSRET